MGVEAAEEAAEEEALRPSGDPDGSNEDLSPCLSEREVQGAAWVSGMALSASTDQFQRFTNEVIANSRHPTVAGQTIKFYAYR